MAHYDPETLILLRTVLDEAWAALPDGSKSETPKSEMAQHILKQAADGVRDPVRLRASALASAASEPPASEANAGLKRRSRIKHTTDFRWNASRAKRSVLEEQAKTMAPGKDREMLLRKARQTEDRRAHQRMVGVAGLDVAKIASYLRLTDRERSRLVQWARMQWTELLRDPESMVG